jgi:restriction endonuclease S subunit
VKYGDILTYTTGAYVGQTNPYLSEEPALASNHVNILRIKNPDIDPVFIALVMNSIVGKLQTEKHIRGSAQAELYPNDIAKFIIPILDYQVMVKIGDMVKQSLIASQDSKRLLEQAKSEVETLIEQAANR